MGSTVGLQPLARQESFNAASAALWSTKQTAEFLGCKEVTLRTWRRTGQGPVFIRVGALVRYSPQAVQEWIDQRKATSTSTPIAVNQ